MRSQLSVPAKQKHFVIDSFPLRIREVQHNNPDDQLSTFTDCLLSSNCKPLDSVTIVTQSTQK